MGWSDIPTGNSYSNNNIFLYLKDGESVTMRLLGKLHYFKKYFIYSPSFKSAVCLDEDTCPVATTHNIRPTLRFAINVLDRRDNKIKVFEQSEYIFKNFKTFYEKTGRNPGGSNGAEFKISVSGVGKDKRYKVTFVGPHSLTEEDVSLIKSKGLHDLKKIYVATDPSKIEEILFGYKASIDI